MAMPRNLRSIDDALGDAEARQLRRQLRRKRRKVRRGGRKDHLKERVEKQDGKLKEQRAGRRAARGGDAAERTPKRGGASPGRSSARGAMLRKEAQGRRQREDEGAESYEEEVPEDGQESEQVWDAEDEALVDEGAEEDGYEEEDPGDAFGSELTDRVKKAAGGFRDRVKAGVDRLKSGRAGKGGGDADSQASFGKPLAFGGLVIRAKRGQRGVVTQLSPGVYLLATVPEPIFKELGLEKVTANVQEVAREVLSGRVALGFLPLLLLPLLTDAVKARRERRAAEKSQVPATVTQLGCCGGTHTQFGCDCGDCRRQRRA